MAVMAYSEQVGMKRQQGGRVIPFDYLIERGSLIHLEEQVGALMEEKYHLPETL